MKKLKFHKIRNAECDFCGIKKEVVTSVNETTYICRKCAIEINRHARVNEQAIEREKVLTAQTGEEE